jgi:acetolactate synthase-1/2/3 large subunit
VKATELIVKCLENEGVGYIFGVPGEENMDLLDALLGSSIRFIMTRHEQGAAFMADVYGRLTGKAGVCLATWGQARPISSPTWPMPTWTARQ